MLIDRVRVEISAGNGGNGVIAWRREKYIPKGGPSGGDGGNGGSVILLVDPNTYALDWFKHARILRAQNGGQGQGGCKKGKNGEDLILKVPPGTLVKDAVSGEIIFDAVEPHQKFLLCRGGKGGKGNFRFRSPTNQAPNICTPGTEGEHTFVEFELKMIADIGLVGFPNAGKSSLLQQLTFRHDVKIGAYPFTTLAPNLGFVSFKGGHRLLMADIPGIIEGAHIDRGLGLEFLRHIERTKMLMYVIDIAAIDGRDPLHDFEVLRDELKAYDPTLIQRKAIIVLNKLDVEGALENAQAFIKRFQSHQIPIIQVSCEAQEGIQDVREALKEAFREEMEKKT